MMKDLGAVHGISITFLSFFVKALSLAMQSYPILNSKIDMNTMEVTLIPYHNIAIAVATPQGLVVPNIKNVEGLSVLDVAREISQLVALANQNKLQLIHLSDSTISLSNIGSIGGTFASPLIVCPQVAIGALGKIQKLPRFDERGNVVPQHTLYVSWSADHRVIDGATIANFSNCWKDYLENPLRMTLNLK
eukprot:TRINITY_DN6782_c0_g2_i4.p1 TRINITY_DN6782_c0_g2~~TRINITY_DN6782_c0_g2_i4.p1  ORF type:complete len:191 (+),score=47.38 TRINITY_DN6782_c0_g2_i4:98-670(+)